MKGLGYLVIFTFMCGVMFTCAIYAQAALSIGFAGITAFGFGAAAATAYTTLSKTEDDKSE